MNWQVFATSVGVGVVTIVAIYNIMSNHMHAMEDRLLIHIAELQRDVHELRNWIVNMYNKKGV